MKRESRILSWLHDTRGATAIEYGMIVTGIAVALIAIIFTMGDNLVLLFQNISDQIMSVL